MPHGYLQLRMEHLFHVDDVPAREVVLLGPQDPRPFGRDVVRAALRNLLLVVRVVEVAVVDAAGWPHCRGCPLLADFGTIGSGGQSIGVDLEGGGGCTTVHR